MTFQLRPFQTQALDQFRVAWPKATAHLGVAPTAFGKSIMMGVLASRLVPKELYRFVILAHREALVRQNADKVLKVDPSLLVGVEMADVEAGPDADVISASIGTLRGKRLERCAAAWRADGRPLFLIVDEAHHSLAPTYREVIAALRPDRLLGLTATPFRPDDDGGHSLREIYPELAFNIPRGPMIDDGWLAKPRHWTIRTHESLEAVSSRAGDFIESQLAQAVDTDERNQLVVAAALECKNELGAVVRGVCFAVNVAHAERLADALGAAGFDAMAITGETPIDERRAWDARLKAGKWDTILVSCGVLTEGWDVEEVNLGLFARPTKSAVLADQMLGRVLRHHEGKPAALVIDFEDGESDRVSIAQTFALPSRWDSAGESLRDEEKWFAARLKDAPWTERGAMWGATCKDDVEQILAERRGPRLMDERGFMWWDLGPEVRLTMGYVSLVVSQTEHGDFEVSCRKGDETQVLGRCGRGIEALQKAEAWMVRAFPREADYCRIGRSDDGRPPSDGQKLKLARLGSPATPGMTMREARIAISIAMMGVCKDLEEGLVGFGRYKGLPVGEIPLHYLAWHLEEGSQGRVFLEKTGRPELGMFAKEVARRQASAASNGGLTSRQA